LISPKEKVCPKRRKGERDGVVKEIFSACICENLPPNAFFNAA
jgi:hypothetical protein